MFNIGKGWPFCILFRVQSGESRVVIPKTEHVGSDQEEKILGGTTSYGMCLSDMSGRKTFLKLCSELSPIIERQITNIRQPIDVEKQVAVTLSDEGHLRKTTNAFGISRASTFIIIRRVTQAISLHMVPKYITLPQTEEDVKEKVYLLGDPKYPLMPFLIKEMRMEAALTREVLRFKTVQCQKCNRVFIWKVEGTERRAMDINIDDLPYVIYACFFLHNFCEHNNKNVSEVKVRTAISYAHDFQPASQGNRGESNESGGKK